MADPNSPTRCIHVGPTGQCTREAQEGSDYCERHARAEDIELKHYLLTEPSLNAAARRQNGVEEIKNLREEIVLCRVLAERRLNMVESNADFLAAIGTINTLFTTLEKLVSSCHRLETSLGTLLSKDALLALAKKIVDVLASEVKDEVLVDKITEKILTLLDD